MPTTFTTTTVNRKRQQTELIYQLGVVLSPIENIVRDPNAFGHDEMERTRARVLKDIPVFHQRASQFLGGEPGHHYGRQQEKLAEAYNHLLHYIRATDDFRGDFPSTFENYRHMAHEAILEVPTPDVSPILAAHTPFQSYCFIRDLCSAVRTQLVWQDRYFDDTIFHRYLSGVPSKVTITLVTQPASAGAGSRDRQRYDAFMDVSKLFAAERGAAAYRLVTNGNFHDRWLRIDDKLFSLGGSVKDLHQPLTIAKVDSSAANLGHVDEAIATGAEVFGPSEPIHP